MDCGDCGTRLKKRKATSAAPYRYEASGMRNVLLIGIEVNVCPTCKGEGPIIPRPLELHDAIARQVANKPGLLSGREARFLRVWADIPSGRFASILGVSQAHLSRFENEKTKALSRTTDSLLRALALTAREERCDVLLELADAKPRKKAPAVFTYRRGWKAAA